MERLLLFLIVLFFGCTSTEYIGKYSSSPDEEYKKLTYELANQMVTFSLNNGAEITGRVIQVRVDSTTFFDNDLARSIPTSEIDTILLIDHSRGLHEGLMLGIFGGGLLIAFDLLALRGDLLFAISFDALGLLSPPTGAVLGSSKGHKSLYILHNPQPRVR
jgi:hypothetical protein